MILGAVDFPYWETFGLRAVFPGLQDRLHAFPAATIYNQMISEWRSLRQDSKALFRTPDLVNKITTLYGAYLLALSKGAAPYELHPRNAPKVPLVSTLVSQTGIDRESVVAFLSTLEKLARSGAIEYRYWDPERATVQNKAVQKTNKAYEDSKPKTPFEESLAAVRTAAWLVGGGVVAFGLYKVLRS